MIPNSDITLYNKYIDAVTRLEKYQRVEVYKVVWQSTDAISRAKEQVAANSALVMIPFQRGNGYLTPKAWQASRTNHWTLQEGDIIVRRIVTDEITSSFTVSDLRNSYDDVMMIMSVGAMDEGSANVQHWEVNCK